MKKEIYNTYLKVLKNFLKFIWATYLPKKLNHVSILVFADGTFDSNALMLVPVANKLNEQNLNVTFAFEYGTSREIQLQAALNSTIRQVSIKKSKLVSCFSLYNSLSFKRTIGYFTYPIVLMRIILESNPSYLLVANDIMLPSKIVVRLCKFMSIPTLSLQHGAICDPFFPIEANMFGVYSEGVKDFIIAKNLAKKEQIISLGNPRWDSLITEIANKKVPIKHCILILSQAVGYRNKEGIIDDNIEEMFKLVSTLANYFPSINIVIKLHPLENSNLWNEKINFSKFHNLSLSNENLTTLLKYSTICISGATTAFIEAALFDLKCIGFRPGKSSVGVPKETEMDYFIEIFEDPKELIEHVQKIIITDIMTFPIEKNLILDYFGYSAQYIANYIGNKINT